MKYMYTVAKERTVGKTTMAHRALTVLTNYIN